MRRKNNRNRKLPDPTDNAWTLYMLPGRGECIKIPGRPKEEDPADHVVLWPSPNQGVSFKRWGTDWGQHVAIYAYAGPYQPTTGAEHYGIAKMPKKSSS